MSRYLIKILTWGEAEENRKLGYRYVGALGASPKHVILAKPTKPTTRTLTN